MVGPVLNLGQLVQKTILIQSCYLKSKYRKKQQKVQKKFLLIKAAQGEGAKWKLLYARGASAPARDGVTDTEQTAAESKNTARSQQRLL